MSAVRPLIFPVSTAIVDRYKNDELNYNLFNSPSLNITEGDNLLIVPVFPEDYKPTIITEVERIQGYTTGFAKISYPPYQFDAEIQDQRLSIYDALSDLIGESISNGEYNLITLYDYHRPTTSEDYTMRMGTLQLTPKSGVIKTNAGKFHTGFTLTFSEIDYTWA